MNDVPPIDTPPSDTGTEAVSAARGAIDAGLERVDALDRLCCDPGRSPRMAELRHTLEAAKAGLETHEVTRFDSVLAAIEDAGAQVGRLQVSCCTPARMPRYASLLEELTKAQLAISAARGTAC